MKKRGLSTVVTTLIMILLVLVAVGVIWIVVANIISEGSEEVFLGKFTLDLEIKDVKINDNSIDVQVKRNTGAGNLAGINFIIGDGVNTKIFEMPTTMGELGSKRFTLPYTGLVKEVSIAPVFETDSGKEFVGNELDNLEFSNEEMMENFGAISWWRFENNAQDEIGGNHGSLEGDVEFIEDSERGMVASFDGVSGYVDCGNDESLSIGGDITIVTWAKLNQLSVWEFLVSKPNNYRLILKNNQIAFTLNIGGWQYVYSVEILNIDEWYHIVVTYDGSVQNVYINGRLSNSVGRVGTVSTNTNNLFIGTQSVSGSNTFNGTIDEPMIFNKALSEEQVKALYELDLS